MEKIRIRDNFHGSATLRRTLHFLIPESPRAMRSLGGTLSGGRGSQRSEPSFSRRSSAAAAAADDDNECRRCSGGSTTVISMSALILEAEKKGKTVD
jgi:hypothetical protein